MRQPLLLLLLPAQSLLPGGRPVCVCLCAACMHLCAWGRLRFWGHLSEGSLLVSVTRGYGVSAGMGTVHVKLN